MRRSLRLRRWQKDALDALQATPRPDFLAVATPGAGKTTFALTAAVQGLRERPHRRVIAVVPTQHLKFQWADAASGFGLHLDPDWASRSPVPVDVHGLVVTYQQVAADPRALRGVADDAFVVLDEIHHAGTDRSWGDAIATAFELAGQRLALSGTPFRSDQNPIPFVRYDFDEAVADHSYGYGDALRDGGVVRPVFFPRLGGHMEWTAPDGSEMAATFDDPLDRTASSQRLRTALSPEGEWLPTVLAQAHHRLRALRQQDGNAGGLAVAMDVEHAHAIAGLLRNHHGVDPVVAVSEDPTASDRIAAFGSGTEPWLVAVRMVSEGVDIPRLRVGVYATNVVTELFFRQAVGRVIRWTPGQRRQKAFVFIPDDPRLRAFAARLGEERTHSLKRREDEGDQPPVHLDQSPEEEQLSLFRAISATPLDDHDPSSVFDDHHPEDLIHEDTEDLTLEIDLPPPPPPPGAHTAVTGMAVSRRQLQRELRQANSDRVQMLANLTGLSHREVNAKLNAEVGLDSIDGAPLRALERRLKAADRWLDLV
ncbi:MAG: DEAD/DEAH box helicase [Nitriliruptorales bacterium]|nr:DEAD/DEAH box helicase [Nitriliruptorales bacterium]